MQKLTAQQKKSIFERISKLDPKGELVTLSPNPTFTGGTIAYNRDSGIILHENITKLTDEEYVRSYIVVRLIKQLKYPADCIEVEKGYTIGRPTGKSAQLDVLVLDKRKKTKTFMLIEAKRPDDFSSYEDLIQDQLFSPGNQEHANGVKYVCWYTLDFSTDEPRDKCIIIDFTKFTEHKEWVEAGEPGHNLDLSIEYGTVRKHKYVKRAKDDTKHKDDLRTDLTRQELTRLQKDFHNVLWGGAKMGDSEVFNNLLKMFLAKIYDEKTTDEDQPYRFQTDLKDGVPETADEILVKVNKIYQEALNHYFKYDDEVLRLSTLNKEKFKPEKVAYVMERLEGISVVENKFEDDILGAFFEAIVRTGFKQEKGQFFTHSNIVRFILYALDLDEMAIDLINGTSPTLPYIADPSCGSGTFLISAMKLITHSVLHEKKDRLKKSKLVKDTVQEWFQPEADSKNIHNRWAREFIYGVEDNEDLAMATKVNMILHGDGNANIEKADGLSDFTAYHQDKTREKHSVTNHPYKFPMNEQFDCVISNPPFSLKEEDRTLAKYGTRFAYADKKNSENLFIERWYQLLKEGGRMGVVLPDSVFDTNENLYIRLFLYRHFFIKAVVSLPQVSFQPYTPTKTSLLFATKKTRKQIEQWDSAWRKAANEYGSLRRSKIIKYLLLNEWLRKNLMESANKTEIEWCPSTNLVSASTLPVAVRAELENKAKTATTSLKKRITEILATLDKFLADKELDTFTGQEGKDALATVKALLRDKVPAIASKMSFPELLETTYDDIIEATELNFSEDPKGQSYCNAWWCFAEVTSQEPFDYEIFFAEAEHVGYKRTTRHPEGIPQPNDLFAENDGKIVIDTDNPKTILDHLRSKRFFFSKPKSLDEAAKIKSFHRKLSHVANLTKLRFGARALHPKFTLLKQTFLSDAATVPLRNLCARPIIRGVQPEYEEGTDIYAVKTGTLRNGHLDFSEPQTVSEEFYERVERRAGLRINDVLISSTGVGSLGKVDLFDKDTPAMVDGHVAIVRLNQALVEPDLLVHLLRHRVVQWQIEQGLTGATNQIEFYPEQMAALRVPTLSDAKRKSLLLTVRKMVSEIARLRSTLQSPEDIINDILCREFKYPLKEHVERASVHTFSRQFSLMASGFTLRNSPKFHHPDFDLTDDFFAVTPHTTVKNLVSVPLRLGATAAKTDLVDEGDAYYVHPGAIRRQGVINVDDCHGVTAAFFDKFKRRFSLKKNDLILNRAGEGTIGKVGVFDSDEDALFSDFTMRIRISDSANPYFVWYFMRSLMFQAQVEREKRGMGNMTNIFPGQVERLLVVECPKPRQDKLVKDISAELKKLADTKASIESKRKEIDALIDAAILESRQAK